MTRRQKGLIKDFMDDFSEKEKTYEKMLKRKIKESDSNRLFCNLLRYKFELRPIITNGTKTRDTEFKKWKDY